MLKKIKYNITYLVLIWINLLPGQIEIETAFPNLTFLRPVDLQIPPSPENRFFVVEQAGIIKVFENVAEVNETQIFLDIRDRVNSNGNEEGLLGLAFHPEFTNNGYFYVNYTASDPRRTIISRFEVNQTNPDGAEKDSEFVLLEIEQPYSNHNGGQISFGPDQYLYIATGDGGSGGDPMGNGQNLKTLLGAILRIDVNQSENDLNYTIPPGNPFKANLDGKREEIFAYGLRNPWRFSFDPITKWLWTADVGQNLYEEINIIEGGKNYGWNIMEGFGCYNSPTCDTTGITLPVWVYDHSNTGGQSVTGGFVYRGNRVAELYGKYIYADFVSGRIWALEYDGIQSPGNTLILKTDLQISTFGTDHNKELYFAAFDGKIYRFKPTVNKTESGKVLIPDLFTISSNFPNPFNSTTTILFSLKRTTPVNLSVYNLSGQLIAILLSGNLQAAEYQVRWDGTNEENKIQSSGIYFYRLQINHQLEQVGQMLFIK